MYLTVIATGLAKQHSMSELVGLFTELQSQVHSEQGCLSYSFHCNENQFVAVEKWESLVCLEMHRTGIVMSEFSPKIARCLQEPMKVMIFDNTVQSGDTAKIF